MEEKTVRIDENEEYEQPEIVEVPEENSGSGSFVAGIVGGFLAYAAIGGVKKLAMFALTKWNERKQKDETKNENGAESVLVLDEQKDSKEEASAEK